MDVISVPLEPIAPEIIWFTPSERFLENPYELLNTVNNGSKSNGMIRNYYGWQLDAHDTCIWVMVWQSLAFHRKFMKHEAYVDVILPVMEAMVGHGEVSQVLLGNLDDFDRALGAPLTQFIYITVRPLHDRVYELVPHIERLKKELKMVNGCFASCWGPCLEEDSVQVGVVGWRSIEDRDVAVKGRLAPVIKLIRELGSVQLKYARLQLHS